MSPANLWGRQCRPDFAPEPTPKKMLALRDLACRRQQRQALPHWTYDSRKI
ncbi:MAG: hypothetical protein WDA20_12280 [Desulfuromonadales bacterium]